MKIKALALIVCLLPVFCEAGEVSAKPTIGIEEVVKIAQKTLAERGYDHVFIEKIALDRGPMFSKKQTWWVQWSAPVQGSKPTIQEIGLTIRMDGSVVHVIK